MTPQHLAEIIADHTLSPNRYCRCGLTPRLFESEHRKHIAAVAGTR